MKAPKNMLDLKMPIRTREEKIIIQALNWLQRLQYEPNKNERKICLKCAIATLETLLLKDDLKGNKNETTK
jgi:hypothetical protein